MSYNNGDPRSFMYYRDTYYINGTRIALKETYIKSHTFHNRKLWKYARFDHQVTYNNGIAYFFCIDNADWYTLREMGISPNEADKYAPYFVIPALELDNAIEKITHPIKLSEESHKIIRQKLENMVAHPKHDWDYPELLILWIIYLIIMVGSLIFKQFYLIWFVATFLFLKFRNEIRK